MEIIKKTNIDFLGLRYICFAISGGLVLLGIIALAIRGVNLGIDFAGGNLAEIKFAKILVVDEVRKVFKENFPENVEIQTFPKSNSFVIRSKKNNDPSSGTSQFGENVSQMLKKVLPENPATIERTEYVGPAVGRHLIKQANWAIIFSFLGIIIYVAFRFNSGIWGAAAVIALIHDVFVTFGIFSLLQKEITLSVIAALLTLAGYSVNDTIVIFDRLRENIRLFRKDPLPKIMNQSLNETLARTLITNLTVIMVLAALFMFGGDVIHDFAFALLFGCIIGTYSTVAIAVPIVYEWKGADRPKANAINKAGARV